MERIEQEPEITEDARDGATRFRHPAYGQISLHRVSGGVSLYGSDFRHGGFMEIAIYESSFTRDLSRDWPHPGRQLISVMLSEAQWATFVSSANMGSGVQCTLDRVMGEARPSIPYRDAEQSHLKEGLKKLDSSLAEIRKSRDAILSSGLSKSKQDAILQHLNRAEMELSNNLKFVADSFAKAMEKRVEKAKVEVNAYMTGAIMRAGLATLKSEAPLLLDGPSDPPAPPSQGECEMTSSVTQARTLRDLANAVERRASAEMYRGIAYPSWVVFVGSNGGEVVGSGNNPVLLEAIKREIRISWEELRARALKRLDDSVAQLGASVATFDMVKSDPTLTSSRESDAETENRR